jgi:metal-responsive CopG/Arc/MetJ family transcriptional regulator
MKEKTSITLSRELLAQIDEIAGELSRSALIERVLRAYVRQKKRAAINARDLELINAAADQLNEEAEDVLRYRAPIEYERDDS